MRANDERPSSGDPANAKRSWGETREARVRRQRSDAARPEAEREEQE